MRSLAWSAVNAVPAETVGPEGNQRGVRRAGHGVLGNAVISGEHAARDVLLVARSRDRRHEREFRQRREVRTDRAHRRFVREQDERIAVALAAEEGLAVDSQRLQ